MPGRDGTVCPSGWSLTIMQTSLPLLVVHSLTMMCCTAQAASSEAAACQLSGAVRDCCEARPPLVLPRLPLPLMSLTCMRRP